MATRIQLRRDTEINWISNDPILAAGEIAISTDLEKIKIGNGSSIWSVLGYINLTPTEIQTTINSAISSVVDGAPALLDTLNELAAALGDDANFSTTITNSISSKAPLNSPTFTGTPISPTAAVNTNTTQIATTAFVNAEIANDALLKTGGTLTGTVSGVSPTAAGSKGFRNITMSTSEPSGGSDGDVWYVYV